MAQIPIVDFGCVGIGEEEISKQPQEQVQRLSKELYDAFTTIGFVYIKNHGIPEDQISNLFQVANAFFHLPAHVKSQSARPESGTNQGWCGSEKESLNPKNPGDIKEFFNIGELKNDDLPWPVVDSSKFKETIGNFFHVCKDLSLRVLDLISIGLQLKDKTFIRRMHEKMESWENKTTLRLLYYPALEQQLKEGQIRCGEHSDYGTITLLFQDSVGGLEVCHRNGEFVAARPIEGTILVNIGDLLQRWTNDKLVSTVCHRNGEFVAARPIEGTILVNIGDLLQRWTNDKLVSTRHRVGVPADDSLRSVTRQSAAFFVHPVNDAVIECLDGSDKYPPITALDYLNQRFSATYL